MSAITLDEPSRVHRSARADAHDPRTTGTIAVADQGPIAAWVQKTALTAMLVSSEEERQNGYGLPASEYRALHDLRDDQNPLAASQFWVGRYQGTRLAAARVTPLVVHVDGLSDPDQPQGYAMTIALGQLVLQGLRFTTPSLEVQMDTGLELPQIWPATEPAVWPDGLPLDDATFLGFAGGKDFRSSDQRIQLRAWRPATELAPSRLAGGMVELPTACGKHSTFYPAALVHEAMRGRFSAFTLSCACSTHYLIVTEPDGARCKAAATAELISELYQALPGYEDEIPSEDGAFKRKRLTPSSPVPTRDGAPPNAS